MLIPWGAEAKPPEYEPERKKMFKKRIDKIRLLFNGVDETSLKKGDKKKLKLLMLEEAKKLNT